MKNYSKNILLISFSFLIYLSFLLGFYFNENSAGAGGYGGDLTWMWDNFEIYKSNDLWTAIHHPDFWGNRTPLLYVLHILFNPFINDIDTYRLTVFCISFLAPLMFYFCLSQKFKSTNKITLFFISSFILLSPYFRTNSYWGGEVNYGIISMLASIFFLNYTLLDKTEKKLNIYTIITLLTFFSSLCIYFDQKLIIIPIFIFFKIMLSELNLRYKIYCVINYSLFAIPFLYLIFIWKGLIPPATQIGSPDQGSSLSTINIYFFHFGYASAIMAFYLLPLIFLKSGNLIISFKNFFYDRINLYCILFFVFYLFYLIVFYDFENFTTIKQFSTTAHGVYGLGILHKISLILFDNLFYRKIFTYMAFLSSWIIVLFAIGRENINILIIVFFYLISLIIFPLMQEYFDPYIIILALLIFKTNLDLVFKKLLICFLYLAFFLLSANLYYLLKFSNIY